MSKRASKAELENIKKAKQCAEITGLLDIGQAVVVKNPDFALAYSALAAWCTRLERHEKAVEHARRVCELEPNEPFSYTALSVACMRAGKIEEAEEALGRSRMMTG